METGHTPETVYIPERLEEKPGLVMNEEQKDSVRAITQGITEVDEAIRSMAVEDVIRTLENGHPLNKLITGDKGEITGYIACEEFIPHEAYIKYFGTTRQTGRSALREIPAFIEYAKQQGYMRLNFHGWNDRLNHVLERFGFERIRTDNMAGYAVDYYEKPLTEDKSPEQVDEERKKAFEAKYLTELNQRYQQTLGSFSPDNKPQKESAINGAYQTLSGRLSGQQDFAFDQRQQSVLRLKLARHFTANESIDLNDLFDAIIESPKFIDTDKGSLHRLLEVHQEKTLQKIAEMRKKRAEMGDSAAVNPWENLVQTESGKYYVARMLNMPHLEEESEYMRHCVGTSDSYINQMKRGEIEILSFRVTPKFDNGSQKVYRDTPIITMEYNLKTKTIEQMKKQDDEYLSPEDPYFADVIDALKQLRTTQTDTGQLRDFRKISDSELGNIKVKDYHILTEHGEVDFHDFNPDDNVFVLKMGEMEITPDMTRTDVAKIIRIVANIDCKPEEIALGQQEIKESTKLYIGQWSPDIMRTMPEHIQHLYESFPEKKIFRKTIELSTKTPMQYEQELVKTGNRISDYAKSMLVKIRALSESERVDLVKFTVEQLGFPNGANLEAIFNRVKELNLELCPPQTGPELRLAYADQPNGEYLRIAMDPITGSGGGPRLFDVYRHDDGPWLLSSSGKLGDRWDGSDGFVFRVRK